MTLRMSESEYAAHQARVRGTSPEQEKSPTDEVKGTSGATNGKRRGQMNRLESAFAAEILEYRRKWDLSKGYRYEPITFRLPGGVKYTPDFMEECATRIIIYECKGFWRPQDRVRFKVAAALFPMFQFTAVRRKRKSEGGGWSYEHFNDGV